MKILCLISNPDRPSYRYRIEQYVPFFVSTGMDIEVREINQKFKRWKLIYSADRYAGVFIQKKLLSRPELWFLRRKAKKIVYDYDDAVKFTKDCFSTKSRRYKRFKSMIEAADLIVAGNEYLADFAGDKNKVIVVPTVVDVSKYPIHSRNGNNVTIGWIGSRSTQNYLENIVPVFKKITDRYPQVIVKIVSDEMSSWSSGNVVWERWGKEKEIEQLLSFDIGIMPLMDDPWTRGKCGFKLIQYMATGIPVVCSPVGVNNSIVQNGVNGFFASGTNDWEEKLSLLIEDKNLYNSMAVNSRNIAEKNYNLAHWGTFLSGKIKSIL